MNSYIMYLEDAFRVMTFLTFFVLTIWFFILSFHTRNKHPDDSVIQQHFLEHAVAGLFSFIGSFIGTIWSVIHLLSTNQGELSENGFSVAILFLLFSGIAFMYHMIKEQTPGHPFYVREVGHNKLGPNRRKHD